MRNKPANDDDTSEVSSSTLEAEDNNEVLMPIAVAIPVPVSNSNVNDDTPSATSVDLSDREAGAAAAAARQACVADIRSHCDSYLQSNQAVLPTLRGLPRFTRRMPACRLIRASRSRKIPGSPCLRKQRRTSRRAGGQSPPHLYLCRQVLPTYYT